MSKRRLKNSFPRSFSAIDMSHSHNHNNVSGIKLLVTVILNFIITLAQLIGGIISGSLALISDAVHNFADVMSLVLTYFASNISKKPRDDKYTFGYKRAEILAAVLNSGVLIGVSIFLIIEAFDVLDNKKEIHSEIMILVAIIGLIANVIGAFLLHGDSKGNLNIKSAYLHLLGDAISSLSVITAGIVIYLFNFLFIDAILTILISIYIGYEALKVLNEAGKVLMQAAPPNISIDDIKSELTKIEIIKSVHHTHLWRINDKDIHFEAHVEIEDVLISQTENVLKNIRKLLSDKFGITHITIQFESSECKEREVS